MNPIITERDAQPGFSNREVLLWAKTELGKESVINRLQRKGVIRSGPHKMKPTTIADERKAMHARWLQEAQA